MEIMRPTGVAGVHSNTHENPTNFQQAMHMLRAYAWIKGKAADAKIDQK